MGFGLGNSVDLLCKVRECTASGQCGNFAVFLSAGHAVRVYQSGKKMSECAKYIQFFSFFPNNS